MSVLTPNFKPFGLSPRVELYDYAGVLQKTYESSNIKCLLPIAAVDFEEHVNDIVGDNNGTITETNLKLRMKFNGDVLDESGLDNNGTLVTGTIKYIPHKDGLAIDLDGSTYIDLDNETNFDFDRLDKFSISMWVKTTLSSGSFVSKKPSGSTAGWTTFISVNGIGLAIQNVATNRINVHSTKSIRDGLWHYVVVTYDGSSNASGVKMYIDGIVDTVIVLTDNLTGSVLNNGKVRIGANQSGTSVMTGQVDNIQIWAAELSAGAADVLFRRDEGFYPTGKIRKKAFGFTGNEHITLANESNFDFERTDKFSIACWFKISDANTHILIAKMINSSPFQGWNIYLSTVGALGFQIINDAGVNDQWINAVTTQTGLDDDVWHHVVATYDGTSVLAGMKVYIDNVLQTLTAPATADELSLTILQNTAVTIGSRSVGLSPTIGLIDAAQIFNDELTSTQVAELFNDLNPYGSVSKTTAAIQDFKLTDMNMEIAGNGNYGSANLMIEDHANALTDTSPRKRSLIKRHWDIKIYMGKTPSTMKKWFNGKTLDTDVLRPGTNQQHLAIPCVGWGLILKDRMTRIERNQDKQSNGIDVDEADSKTRLDNLILDIFNKQDHQIDENIKKISSIVAVKGSEGICSECLSIKLANVNELGNSYAGFIARMVNVANSDWFIDPDKKLVIRDSDAHDSGFLFTDDLTSTDAVNWDSKKIAYIKNDILGWKDTSFNTMYSWIHGFGHFNPTKDVVEENTPNSSDNIDDEFIAIPISPTRDNIFKIAVRMIRTGTPPSTFEIQIRGDNAGNPDPNDIRRTIKVSKEFLSTIGTTVPAKFIEFPIKPKLEIVPNEQLYIVFPRYGDASNTLNINYLTGTGTYRISFDDIAWTSPVGSMAFRVYSAKRLITSLENTVLSQILPEPREKMFPVRADLEEKSVREALINASTILGKERRIYDKIKINAPDDPIPLASFCRVADGKTGLDITATILAYKLELHSRDHTKIGANEIELTLDDIHSV